MSNKNMRTRNLDHAKPLVVYDAVHDELPERLDIASGITRTTNNAPTGMEKEEELEHHLQLALTAAQHGDTKLVAIPIPAVVEVDPTWYERLYPSEYKKEPELYRVQGLSAGPEPDVVDYCLDEEDERWLSTVGASFHVSHDRFETIIDRLEKSTGAQIISKEDALQMLNDRAELVSAIYLHWAAKRQRLGHGLIARVRTENKRDAQSSHDPYVAFRRRAEKMQTRKNRKSDEQNYILMFKLRIAHTQALMRDGIMDVLKSLREREVLKLRTSLVERHEFQMGNVLFGDAIGEMSHHVLENYPEMSRIEAQDFVYSDDEEHDGSDGEQGGLDDSLEDFSEVSDSTDSWARLQAVSSAPSKSRHFEDEADENVPHASMLALSDPNFVSESQYKGDEPPEYWSQDGEFTFVPRKDCTYVVEELSDCDSEGREDDRLDLYRGYYLQDIPVMSAAKRTVIKSVYARRTLGRNATQYLNYLKLPNELSCRDWQRLRSDFVQDEQDGVWDEKERAFLAQLIAQEEKVPVYAFTGGDRQEDACVPEDEECRMALTDEDLEEIYQLALRWQADGSVSGPISGEEALKEGEEWQDYQVACSSVCQPLNEHNYCLPPVYGDLDFLVSESASNELEGADADATSETATEAAESLSLDVVEAEPLVIVPATVSTEPPTLPQQVAGTIQAAIQAPSSPLTAKKKVTAPARKPRMPAMPVTTPTVPLEMNATSTNATLKRNISQVPEKETKKPPRKRTKAGEGDKTAEEGNTQSLQSSNENNAALPVVLGPPMGNVVRTTAVLPNGLTGTLIPLGIALKKAPVAKAVRKPPVKKETKSLTFRPPSTLTTPLVFSVGDKPSVNGGGIIGDGKAKRKAPATTTAAANKKKKEAEGTTMVSISNANGPSSIVSFPVSSLSSLSTTTIAMPSLTLSSTLRSPQQQQRSVVSVISSGSTTTLSSLGSISTNNTNMVRPVSAGRTTSAVSVNNPNLQALLMSNGSSANSKTALSPTVLYSKAPFVVSPEHTNSATPPAALPHSVVVPSTKLC